MLNFIKKHYEKMILTALLIVFVALLVIQLSILLEGRNVNKDELKLNLKTDYKRVNFAKDQKFETFAKLSDSAKWLAVSPRTPGDKVFSDLCAPLELAKCPKCEHLIPTSDFKNLKCSFCGYPLAPVRVIPVSADDDDKDGIPNVEEIKLGLNPKDPKDAEEDLDGDGFSNLEEYLAGTDIRDPKKHPAYVTKLAVLDIVRKKLNMKVGNIMCKGDDKSKWMVQVSILENGKDRTRFLNLGANSSVKGDDGEFKLLDIAPEFKTEIDPTLKAPVEKNYSKAIFVKTGLEDKLIGEIGKDIVESKEKIVLFYAINSKKLELYVGDAITLGDERTGVEKYTVASCDPAKMTVVLKDGANTVELQQRKLVEKSAGDKPAGPNLPF